MRQIVIFELGKEAYGIDIKEVVEIVLYQEVRQLPDAPSYIEGILNLREEILPVFNLRNRFNMDSKEIDDNTKIIVLRTTNMNVGFIVDNVSEILNIPKENISAAPNIIGGSQDEKYIRGLARQEERIIVLLDVDKLISEEDASLMDEITEE